MHSTPRLRLKLTILTVLVVALSGCGYKGPLTLPDTAAKTDSTDFTLVSFTS